MAKKVKPPYNTFIRNFYSHGISSLMVCLFRHNASFRLDPFSHEDANGRKRFDFI